MVEYKWHYFTALMIVAIFFNPLSDDRYYGDKVISYNYTDEVIEFLSEVSEISEKYVVTPNDTYMLYEDVVDSGKHTTEKVITGKILPGNAIQQVDVPKVLRFSIPTEKGDYILKEKSDFWFPKISEDTNKDITQIVYEAFEIEYEVVDMYKKSLTSNQSYFIRREFRILNKTTILGLEDEV